MKIEPLGDTALLVELGDKIDEATHQRVQSALQSLENAGLPGVFEIVPAYATVTIFYDPEVLAKSGAPADDLAGWLGGQVRERLADAPAKAKSTGRVVEIPVCYGGAFGPDLDTVARHTKLDAEEVIRKHAAGKYLVYLVGFAPGFPYLGGMPGDLATPRRATPRTKVPAGSVGIAGEQTGIYPFQTPGGWNIIGRTPARVFRPDENPPVLVQAGDRVRFKIISADEFAGLEGK